MKFDKKRFLTLLLISVISLILIITLYIFITVPRVKTQKEEEPLRIVKTYEGTAVFYFDTNYLIPKQRTLHKDASLELFNKDKEIYFVYIQNNKTDFRNFQDFVEYKQKENSKLYGITSKISDIKFLKEEAKSFIFKFTNENLEIYLHSLLFENDFGYHELLIWGELAQAEQIDSDLLSSRIEFLIDS